MVRQKAPKAGTSTKLEGNRGSSGFSRSRIGVSGEVLQRVVLGILVGRADRCKMDAISDKRSILLCSSHEFDGLRWFCHQFSW